MKLNNGKNIITDTDITMTDTKNIGRSLSDVINKLSQDIDRLNSNVKWIYKYGGVGSGSGSGGSGESEKPWNFKVEIDDVAMVDGDTVNLGKQGEYNLSIQLYKVKGRTFTIKVTYPTETGNTSFTQIIPPTSSSRLEKIINLQYNGRITIAINDDEGNYLQFTFDVIVQAYLFKIEYVNGDPKHSKSDIENHNIFVNRFKETGLLVKFTLIISAEKTENSSFTYTDWSGQKLTMLLKNNKEEFYLPLGVDITNENAGNYTFLIDIHLTLLGNIEEEKIESLKLLDNLIPDKLYLKVESDGVLYNFGNPPPDKVLEPENVYKFYAGAIAFRVTPFQGALNTTSNHEFKVWVNDNEIQTLSELLDQLTLTIEITTDVIGENKIKFEIRRKGEVYEQTYYFWTKNPAGSFKWYPLDNNGNISVPSLGYKYVYTKSLSPYPSVKLFKGINSNYTIKKNILDAKETIYQAPFIDSEEENLKQLDLLISVGLKYDTLNDDKKELMSIQGSTSDYTIHIYLNKILYMGYEMKIYFPKDNKYHLLTFYKRAVSLVKANAQPLFELNVYIDGVLEISNPSFIVELELYNQITLKNLLYEINLLEISYFKHKASSNPELTNEFLKYNPDPNKEFPTFLNDAGILYYYYTYNLTFNEGKPEAVSKIFLKSYTYASLFYVDYFANRVKVNDTLISGINDTVNIPILMVEYTEPKGLDENWTSDGEDIFKNWMEKGYESHESDILKEDKPVNVYWSNGISKLNKINLTGDFVNTHFNLTLQGTSTLMYTSKNFDLSLYNNEDTENVDKIYLFSPNYSESDPSSFLPEKRFTLKADVVDSSHSNNNALGKFINTITTHFKEAQLPECPLYSSHIKNTLEGFPILMFFKNNYYKTKITLTLTSDIYYLGIYNFNLGRDSEFNLGYKDLRLLPENGIPEGFNLISIPIYKEIINNGRKEIIDARSYLGGFGVAEVNENLAWNDFSQFDDSILFPIVPEDKEFMFAKIKGSPDIIKDGLRSLVTKVSKAGGYIFESLKKNFPENGGYDVGYRSEIPKNLVTNYKTQMIRSFVDSKSLLNLNKTLEPAHDYDLRAALFGVFDERGLLIDKPALDYRALSEYYVCCMAMGLVDSVMKNLNLRTWNNKTFYPSFYDMDTALGKDNAGNSTDYLAFSDYWKSKLKVLNEELCELLPSMSYKDWCPPTVHGFDTPMTYLLAIAKYAYLYIDDDNLIEDWYPNNLWARMRRGDTKNINAWISKPVDTNNKHLGCLKNADSFINNFFKKHLEEVPDIFFNLDYRKKYFILNEGVDSNGYRQEDIARLSGKRIYSVHDWLNGRLHILDLYFNIARVPDTIKYYDEHSLSEDHFVNDPDSLVYKLPKELFIDGTNQDILIKQNIFSADSKDVKYSYNIEVKFKAESDSPLGLSGSGMTQRYITGNNLNIYLLKIPSENKAVGIGGSKTWTELDKIDSLIQTHKDQSTTLYINSDKLTNLVGTSGTCNGWTITMPALQEVSLTGPNYSGILEFKTGEKTWENLKTINISGTHLGLDLNNVKVTTVKANNITTNSNLYIANCNYLSTLEILNSRFNLISLSTYDKVSYFSTNIFEEHNEGKSDWYDTGKTASSPKCNSLNMLCKNKDGGVIFINNLVYNKDGSETGLKEITLSGYREIYISDCPYLSRIIINDPNIVEKFIVTKSSHNASSLTIGPDQTTLKTLDLRQFTKLKELNFKETSSFDTVHAPDNVLLIPNAFAQTNIKYLSGKNIVLSNGAFHQAWQFTALASPEKLENGQINLTDFSSTTLYNPGSLIGTFWGNNISLETFSAFNLKYKDNLILQLTNVTNMWGYVSGLSYSDKDLLEDYKKDSSGNTCKIDISMYKNVTNANGMLTGTNKTACHPAMLKGLGQNVSRISIHNIFGWGDLSGKIIYMPENWLTEIKDKVYDLNQSSLNNYIKVVNYDPIKQELVLKITFKPWDIFPAKNVTSFVNWLFEENHIIDFSGHPFNLKKYPNLLQIVKSFGHCLASNLTTPYHNDLLEHPLHVEDAGFLYDITPSLTTISGSFGFNNYKNLTVNLNNFVDWLDLRYEGKKHQIINFFSYTPYWDDSQHVFEFNKTISSIKNFELIYKLLLTKYTNNSLSHLFLNCSVVVNTLEKIYLPTTNNYITEIPYLFSNLQFLLDKKKLYIDWDWNMLKNLPKLKNLKYAFLGMWFNNCIPFNAFNLRSSRTYDYYMLIKNKPRPEGYEEPWDDEIFVPAKYTKITYTLRIENMEGTFKNCNFSLDASYFNYKKVNNLNGVNSSESVTYTDLDGQLLYSEYYYSGNNSLSSKIYIKHPEYDDMHLEGINDSVVKRALAPAMVQESDLTPLDYDNFTIPPDAVNCPFVTPDIFYGCVNNVNIKECFAESSLNGYIPDNLFIKCRQAKLSNFLRKVLIVPKLYKSLFDIDKTNKYKISYYIGHNFIETTNLDYAFNFRINLPGLLAEESDLEHTYKLRNLFVFSFIDSFHKSWNSAVNMLPDTINTPQKGLYFVIQNRPSYSFNSEKVLASNDSLLNIMYNHLSENPNRPDIIGELGLNLNYYNRLYCDKLVNSLFMLFIFGLVFDKNSTLSSIKKLNISDNNWVMEFGNGGKSPYSIGEYNYEEFSPNQFAVSSHAILPIAPSSNLKSIYTRGIFYNPTTLQYIPDGAGIPVLKKLIGNNELYVRNYLNSRSNNGWNIAFY